MAASLSEQENLGLLGGLAAIPQRGLAGCGAAGTAAPPPPFRFSTPRQLIDWRALHALDLAAVVRDTDIDALESVLDIVVHGDMEGEDGRHLTPANAARAFRVAQLAVDYLLHVQDRLADDACSAKVGVAWLWYAWSARAIDAMNRRLGWKVFDTKMQLPKPTKTGAGRARQGAAP